MCIRDRILSVTFTNKAAKEMQNRVSKILKSEAIGLTWLGTFHSISAKLVRKHAKAVGLNSNFTILDTDDQIRLIKNICKSENIDVKKISPKIIKYKLVVIIGGIRVCGHIRNILITSFFIIVLKPIKLMYHFICSYHLI